MKWIINTTIFLLVILLFLYIGSQVLVKYDVENNAVWERLGNIVAMISGEVWNFGRPFVQLVIMLLILEWLVGKFGIKIIPENFKLDGSVQTVIALLVVSAFCLAALGNIPGMGALKDLALVVVGFYFGSHRLNAEETKNKTATHKG